MSHSENTVFRSMMLAGVWISVACCRLSAAERLQITGETMGTYYSVTIDSPPATASVDHVRGEIGAKLAEINAQMSTWDSESEISGFNQSDSTDWFEVSPEFAAVVREAKRIHKLTSGAFDPTVSPLIDLWGFGKPDTSGIPNQTEIDRALQSVGMQHLEVQDNPSALRKTHATLQLNLSAIAKGYTVDEIAALLVDSDLCSFVVDIGGETRTGIAKANGDPWRVGIESPKAGLNRNERPGQIVPITESSIATSGDYRNFFEVDGVAYSHTINPVTGYPMKDPPASVSVIHKSCMTADAMATALMVLGPDKGLALAKQQGLTVLFQLVDANSEVTQLGTGRFEPQQKSSEEWVVYVAAGIVFLVAVGGMAIGVLISNRQIKGSCGGLASMPGSDGKSICELCTIPREDCVNEELRNQMASARTECEDSFDGSPNPLKTQSEHAN